MKNYVFSCILIVLFHHQAYGQAQTGTNATSAIDYRPSQAARTLTFSAYTEAWYGFDFNRPAGNTLPAFIYSHNRHNEVNINFAYIKAYYSRDRVHSSLALATGTYMNANYTAEPGLLKNIYEANAGVKLSARKDVWLDVGVLPAHIGFESARSVDCPTLTRSIIADNSPYYESGARLSYKSANGHWYMAGLVLNGWQRIQRPDGNSAFAAGTQLTYTPSKHVTLNYSTFLGSDRPDSTRQTRIFHNLYGIFHITDRLGATIGFDYGIEQQYKGSTAWNNWMGGALILQYKTGRKTAVALRGEYYDDKYGVIVVTHIPDGFTVVGYSANFDYRIMEHVLWRTEAKLLKSPNTVFTRHDGSPTDVTPLVATSLAVDL